MSTDPASNLDEVLETRLGIRPTPIAKMTGLQAMNVDPEEAARLYRERVVGPYRELLPKSAVDNIEEQLSGACTVEIAAFDEFAKLLGDQIATAEYDHIIFDTAPTGHTLRLLQLPAAWTGFHRDQHDAEHLALALWRVSRLRRNSTQMRCKRFRTQTPQRFSRQPPGSLGAGRGRAYAP